MQSFGPVQVRISFYLFPIHDELADIIPAPSYPSRVPKTPTIFRLPYDIFQEIFLNLPTFPRTEVYRRSLCGEQWSRPNSELFWERPKTLLALSATCRAMREIVLMESWKHYVLRLPVVWLGPQFVELSQCEILLGNPHLAYYVR